MVPAAHTAGRGPRRAPHAERASPTAGGSKSPTRAAGCSPRKRVFRPFHCGTASAAGRGLGLAIVRGIAEAHGARPGSTTALERALLSGFACCGENFGRRGRGAHRLLPADRSRGARIRGRTRCHGRRGARAAAPRPPDLIVLDLALPDMDGLDVLRRLREEKRPVPVMILTARSDVDDLVDGLDLGARLLDAAVRLGRAAGASPRSPSPALYRGGDGSERGQDFARLEKAPSNGGEPGLRPRCAGVRASLDVSATSRSGPAARAALVSSATCAASSVSAASSVRGMGYRLPAD